MNRETARFNVSPTERLFMLLPNEHVVQIHNLNQGAAVELFNDALRKVIDNIHDPNVDVTAKREITLKVKFSPSLDRNGKAKADVGISCAIKLGASKPATTTVFFGKVEGKIEAVESDPDQGALFDASETKKGLNK